MSFLRSYLGFGGAAATTTPAAPKPQSQSQPKQEAEGGCCKPQNTTDQTTAVRALPASWYISQEMYDLEKRAIFSKMWLLTTNTRRIPNKGDWQRYQVSGFHYVVCRDAGDKILGIHIDAGLDEFTLEEHGILPVHVHVDAKGFVWVNLDGAEEPEIAWSDAQGGSDTHERLDMYDWDSYVYDHTWEMEGEYNWKLLGDNYNECYHCRVAHPDLRDLTDINTYVVEPVKSYLLHFGSPTPDMVARGFKIAPTYFFPNASVNVSRNFFMMQRFIPNGYGSSIMRYEVYRNRNCTDAEFEEIDSLYKRVMSEDKYLAIGAQKNIESGVFVNGEMHPGMEKGAIWFQSSVRDRVMEHFEREQAAGREIWPAQPSMSRIAHIVDEKAGVEVAVEALPEAITV